MGVPSPPLRMLRIFSFYPHKLPDCLLLACLPSPPTLLCVSGHPHLLFRRDVAVHQRAALHASHLDVGGDVPELQAQVLSSDGDLGSPFSGACHWDYLEGGSIAIWQAPRQNHHPLANGVVGQGNPAGWSPSPPGSQSWVQVHQHTQVWDRPGVGASVRAV